MDVSYKGTAKNGVAVPAAGGHAAGGRRRGSYCGAHILAMILVLQNHKCADASPVSRTDLPRKPLWVTTHPALCPPVQACQPEDATIKYAAAYFIVAPRRTRERQASARHRPFTSIAPPKPSWMPPPLPTRTSKLLLVFRRGFRGLALAPNPIGLRVGVEFQSQEIAAQEAGGQANRRDDDEEEGGQKDV